MLNCREITEHSSDYLDAALPWRVRLQLRLHLVVCRFCREYVRQMSLVVRSPRGLPREEPSAETQRELLAVFRAQHG